MKLALVCAVLYVPLTLLAADENSPASNVIEVQQTSGFSGVNINRVPVKE